MGEVSPITMVTLQLAEYGEAVEAAYREVEELTDSLVKAVSHLAK
jgi:hypothetical protein